MNKFKVAHPRENLDYEMAFTKAYREAIATYQHPVQIELACMKAQYPAVMHPIQPEDMLAGRIQMGLVGLGIQQQTGGFGFYMDEDAMVKHLETSAGNAFYRESIHDMLVFWKSKNTTAVVARNTPTEVKQAIFSDHWKVLPLPASPIYRSMDAWVKIRTAIPWNGQREFSFSLGAGVIRFYRYFFCP